MRIPDLKMSVLAMAAIAAVPSVTLYAQQLSPQPIPNSGNSDLSTMLAQKISAEVGGRSATASADDLEGFIVFIVSQADYPPESILTALNTVDAGTTSPALKQAIVNVRMSLLGKRLTRGTAAIRTGGFGGVATGTTGFSTPITNPGGGNGGSNYNN